VKKKHKKDNSKPIVKKINNLKKNLNDSVSDISESVAIINKFFSKIFIFLKRFFSQPEITCQ
jgi:hypothetical protein